jgi:hypothetical protein
MSYRLLHSWNALLRCDMMEVFGSLVLNLFRVMPASRLAKSMAYLQLLPFLPVISTP